MPRDLIARLDWGKINPYFAERVFELLARCRKRGVDYFAISGYRSPEEQAKLYFQGRTTPGKIVTNARPWQSAHNYGCAVDFCRDADLDRAGLQPAWKLEDYIVLAEEAEKLELEPGLRWKTFREGPHVQLPLSKAGVSLVMLKGVVDRPGGSLKSAWSLLSDFGFRQS